ncbi:hypothetical protein DFP74_1860 [Nocardiopsis sp. Huas11]|uniref:hypothetical protein n=1 Tax=Nocardiopsis sp. Huas11 TaxID=2183912 RepID=UPI000EAD6CC0|nr:hypothetical protein [Nocardiopsis sp. Huas11]RKS06235.1 hypothetical protein DFP74_1860 [Nocardiopsis sp. Huas11]
MFDLIITLVGVATGVGLFLVTRLASKAHSEFSTRLARGEIGEREARRAHLGLHLRTRNVGRAATGIIAALLAAVLVHAALTEEWGGRTLYYVLLLTVLMMWCVAGLRQSERLVDEARRENGS